MNSIFSDIRKELKSFCDWFDSGKTLYNYPDFSCFDTDWYKDLSRNKTENSAIFAITELLGMTEFALSHADPIANGFEIKLCVDYIRKMRDDLSSTSATDLLQNIPEPDRSQLIEVAVRY